MQTLYPPPVHLDISQWQNAFHLPCAATNLFRNGHSVRPSIFRPVPVVCKVTQTTSRRPVIIINIIKLWYVKRTRA